MFNTYHPQLDTPNHAVDVKIEREGDKVFSRDVFQDGSLGVIKTPWFPDAKSPEHAEIMAEILTNPAYTILLSNGFFTDEKLDQMAEKLREIRCANSLRRDEP